MRTLLGPAQGLCLAALAVSGCAPAPGPLLAREVIEAPGAGTEGTRDPRRAVDGVRGAGERAGSLDVYSLSPGEQARLVLGFEGARIVDGPGDELVVFENPFLIGDGPYRFVDPLIVEVSRDAVTWVAFPVDYRAPDPTRHSADPRHWHGFAGVTPVLLHEEDAPGDPFDPLAAGGDHFDLSDLPADDPEADAIRAQGFGYVRLTSARLVVDPRTGAPFPHNPASDGPDIDGVYAHLR